MRPRIVWFLNFLPALTAALLAACGGNHNDEPAAASAGGPARGTLLQQPPELVSYIAASTLLAQLSARIDQAWLGLGDAPLCDVAVHKIRYTTVGGANEDTEASGALMIPSGLDASCRGARPMVLYAHGTSTDRAYNIADIDDQENAEGLLMTAFFASQGYIVVAPNYAGYDTSTLPYHPYLNADQESKDMIDALTAARSALPTTSAPLTTDDGRLFITGYSQGGHVAMATHRALQAAGMTVTASAPMSGPYALAAFIDAVFYGQVNDGAPISFTLLVNSYQKSYGNLYMSTADIFEAQYATGIDTLLPTTLTRSDLYAQGKLPQTALFSSTPPDPAFASITPPTLPANLAPVFATGFGANNLVKNSYRLSYLLDAQAHPDGGWPTTTTTVPADAPGHALRIDAKQNDLRNWKPNAPMLLCGGNEDPTVFWLNTQLMQGYWAASAPPPTMVTVLDVDSAAGTNDPYSSVKSAFSTAKQLVAANAVAHGASDGGASAVAEAYHTTLVAPACLAAVKSFFGH